MFKQYKYQIYLICLVLLAYWPFTFFISSLLHDNIDVALPVKYYASECISNGFLPLWNPFQLWGFPAHADLQYTNWNLETITIGSSIGYNYYVLHILFIFYLILGSIGVFNLSKYLSKNALGSFYISAIYILSGIVIGHTQSLVTILGIVFLPFVFLYFLKWLETPSLKHSVLFVLFFYLLLTMGYQAFAFMIIPVFITLICFKLIEAVKIKNPKVIKLYLGWGAFIILILGFLFLPIIISQKQTKSFVSRLNGMSVTDVMDNPFPVMGLLSLINPLFTIGHDDWFNTELTMRNIFIGTFPLISLFFILVKRHKSKLEIILFIFITLYFLASFGNVLPIRKVLYYTIPGFNLFRFPALLRVVVELLLLILLAINFDYLFNRLFQKFKLFKQICLSFSFIFFLLGLYLILDVDFKKLMIDASNFKQFITSLDVKLVTSIVLLIQALLLMIFVFFKFKNIVEFKKTIIVLTIIELSIVVSIYGKYTSFSEIYPSQLQSSFNKMPKGFVTPSKEAIGNSNFKFSHVPYYWKNTGVFKKKLIVDDPWTSFYFSNYHALTTRCNDLVDTLKSYPFVYATKSSNDKLKWADNSADTSIHEIRNSFQFQNTKVLYEYIQFNPKTIQLIVALSNDAIVNLQQAYYPGWECEIDSVKTNILLNAGFLMSVKVPKGIHVIRFNYSNPLFEKALYVSYGVFIILLILLLVFVLKSGKVKVTITVLILFIAISFIYSINKEYEDGKFQSNSFLTLDGKTYRYYPDNSEEVLGIFQTIDSTKANVYTYSWRNFYHSPEFWYRIGVNDFLNPELYQLNGSFQWNKNTIQNSLSLMDLISGNQHDTLILNSDSPYSPSIDITSRTNNLSEILGKIMLRTEKNAAPVIVCVIKQKNKLEKLSYFELRKYVNSKTLCSLPFYFKLPESENDIEYIKLFVMNNSKQKIEIMNLEMLNNQLSQLDKH